MGRINSACPQRVDLLDDIGKARENTVGACEEGGYRAKGGDEATVLLGGLYPPD